MSALAPLRQRPVLAYILTTLAALAATVITALWPVVAEAAADSPAPQHTANRAASKNKTGVAASHGAPPWQRLLQTLQPPAPLSASTLGASNDRHQEIH